MRSFLLRLAPLALGSLLLQPVARADIMFGGNARAYAMGGAGIAIVDRYERTAKINPAALALFNRRSNLEYPNIGLHASGIGIGAAWDHITGNPSKNDAVNLARDFGKNDSSFGVNISWGLRFGHLDGHATGVAQVFVQPNLPLQAWAKNANGDVAQLATNPAYAGARADLLGAGIYSLPTIGVAERISPAGSPTRIEAGARIKLMRAVYTHYIVSSSNIINNTAASPAPELNGGSTLTQDGIGVDLGFLVHPSKYDGLSGALLITDVVEPGFVFQGTDRNGNPAKYDLQPRSFTIGSAYAIGKMVFAADAVDLSRAYGNVQGRLGAEYTSKKLSLRAGYSSARGFTAGFGWGFLQFAFGAKAPLEVTQTLRF